MAEENASKWPDLAKAATFLTVVMFAASLAYIQGLGIALGANLFGLCDLADYLRLAPSWAIPGLGGFIFQLASKYADYEAPAVVEISEEERARRFKVAHRNNGIWVGVLGLIGVVSAILAAVFKNLIAGIFAVVAWGSLTLAVGRLTLVWLPGYIRFFRLSFEFSALIPDASIICAAAFFWALFIVGPNIDSGSVRNVTMKDHSVIEGRVVLELSRFLVLKTGNGKLLAVQNAEVETLEFLPRDSGHGSPSPSSTPSPTPKAKAASIQSSPRTAAARTPVASSKLFAIGALGYHSPRRIRAAWE